MRLNVFSATAAVVLAAGSASALTYGDVTPDVIFGDGNANGDFTISTGSGVEIGLRAKLRFNESNRPENTFNRGPANTYTFAAGTPPTGFGFAANAPTTPIWNFEWSINSDVDGSSGSNLDALTYVLSLDADPGIDTNPLTFDPINVSFADHSIGDNTTTEDTDAVAGTASAYADLISENNVAQNSWSYEFFNDTGTPLESFDPNVIGTYTISLAAFASDGSEVAKSTINVNVVPVPAALPLLASMTVIGFGAARLRTRMHG